MDYRSMVNPTYLTAKSTLYMLASAENEDAKQIIALLGTEDELTRNRKNAEGSQPLFAPEDIQAIRAGSSIPVEARYAAVSRLLRTEGCASLLDIACGYTPRSLYCFRAGIDYVGVDVPVVAEELQTIVNKAGIKAGHPVYTGGDATNAASLAAAADMLRGKLLISCEGLLSYLSEDEFEQLLGGIRGILLKHGGAWITSDPGVNYEKFAVSLLRNPDAVQIYRAARKQATDASNIYNEGVAHWPSEKLKAFIQAHGFRVEEIPFWHGDEDLVLLRRLPPEWKDALEQELKASRVWKMTADEAASPSAQGGAEKITGAKEVDNLRIGYRVEDGVLLCRPEGRIDTISAPALMEVFENNYGRIHAVEVDAEKLEYISSAGLRVLMMAVKKTGHVKLIHVSDEVKEIFSASGFDQLMAVE